MVNYKTKKKKKFVNLKYVSGYKMWLAEWD